jgi:hypothetical protein
MMGGPRGFVARGAFGIFFTPVDMNTFCNQRHVPPLIFAETGQSDNFIPSLAGFDFAPAALGTTVISFAAADPRSPPQYISQWSFSVEKGFPRHPPPARPPDQQCATRTRAHRPTPAVPENQFSPRHRVPFRLPGRERHVSRFGHQLAREQRTELV